MAKIAFNSFKGSVPRMAPHLVSEQTAAVAVDCRFDHGTLQSWREPRLMAALLPSTRTVYDHECCTLEFDGCVDVVEGAATCRRLYTTGDQPWPAVMSLAEDCTMSIRRLGLPCIYDAPDMLPGAMNGAPEKNTEFRSYAYQYVDSFGNRSALSLGSPVTEVRDGQTVLVSGFVLPSDPTWDVAHLRIYRTTSGYQTGLEDANVMDTVWMFVAEIPASAPSYVDNLLNESLASALEEDEIRPPPADLLGLTAIASMNALAGFVGNTLHFSSPNNYHDWRDYLTLDDNIQGITESNGVIYVMTDGRPYAVAAIGDCRTVACRSVLRFDEVLPAVGFGRRQIVPTTFGAVYVTHEGIVALQGKSPPKLLTSPLYAPDDFYKLVPRSLVLATHDGYLFAFGGLKSFVMKLHGVLNEGWDADTHSQLSDTDVSYAYVTRQGQFLLIKNHQLVEWNRGLVLRPHQWTSGEAVVSPPVPMAAGLIHLEQGWEHIVVKVDGRNVLDRDILKTQEFSLPRWAKGQRWQIQLEGIATVKLVSLADSMRGF